MSWVLTFAGFAALIVLHELGHFTAAKAVGMRVERFALFFPPLLFKVRRGETEYGIGAIPLGGYVRITGMNPNEDIPPEAEHRAYYRQAVWKRVVVILAGPAMNVLVAFLILWGLFLTQGKSVPTSRIASQALVEPARGVLHPGDVLVSIDGRRGGPDALRAATQAHRCPGRQVSGCVASTPATVVVRRGGRLLTVRLRPRYDAAAKRMRIGFAFAVDSKDVGPAESASLSVTAMWRVTKGTVSALVRIFQPEQRKQISGVVGTSEALRQRIQFDAVQALNVLAIISLSLAIVNLFPFLPLDGGHVFWALAEKVRGRPIPFSVMERAGVIGFFLVLMLFVIGLSNDIGRLRGEGFGVR
ncbi:MAG: regulator of sigma protease [Solirubrobacteraceae bacterium]|jgi:regulator of sigma E protease|nr:regulator of sigma protease [Solirubrobacteraceae bacterium]